MIFVYKTSVSAEKDIAMLQPHLDNLNEIKWNFDLEDCDKILRIDSKEEVSGVIVRILLEHGFKCEELAD
jgi:hypothetical protein